MSESGQVVVIKVGGAALNSVELPRFLKLLANEAKIIPVLVHGGGALTDEMLSAAGLFAKKCHGQRMTAPEHLDIVVGSLAGVANKRLIATVQGAGFRGVGLSLADGPMAVLTQIPELGLVGVPTGEFFHPAGKALLSSLINADFVPVISSIGIDASGQLLNVNADYAAAVVAAILQCPLYLLSDVDAVLDSAGNTIPTVNEQVAEALIETDVVVGGMRVKLEAALLATRYSRRTTAIAGWKYPDRLIALLREDVQEELTGTVVLPGSAV